LTSALRVNSETPLPTFVSFNDASHSCRTVLKPFGAHGSPAPPPGADVLALEGSIRVGFTNPAAMIHTKQFMGLLPRRFFFHFDRPYHSAPLCSIKCMNDIVPIEHG
jgi:hypothetical protein